jgi:hypothetical protein
LAHGQLELFIKVTFVGTVDGDHHQRSDKEVQSCGENGVVECLAEGMV